jgi:hypothetical protein
LGGVGGLFPLPFPDGLPVVLGALTGLLVFVMVIYDLIVTN